MKYNYTYDKNFGTLQKLDENGVILATMQMPQSDLNKIAQLNIKLNVLRKGVEDDQSESRRS